MDDKLQKIIQNSSYRVVSGSYIYAKVASAPKLSDCFLVSQDEDEISVVVEEKKYNTLDAIERNKDLYKLIELSVSVPFYAVGFLAAVTNAIADKGMNVLVISTYSKDYLLVRIEHELDTVEVLEKLGFSRK